MKQPASNSSFVYFGSSTQAEVLPWQREPWCRQMQALAQSRVPHALLIAGEAGLGKRPFAQAWAQRLLCQTRLQDDQAVDQIAEHSCGHCKSCLLFMAGNHIDFKRVAPEDQSAQIKVDQVRSVNEFVFAKPQIAARRVVIIAPADKLNLAGSNALLKCLEEPADNSFIILVSSQPSYLPATIRSRCQRVVISQPNEDTAVAWLGEQTAKDDHSIERIRGALTIAKGAPLLAKHLLSEDLLDEYESMRDQFWRLFDSQCSDDPQYADSRYAESQGTENALTLAHQWSQLPIESVLQKIISWSHMAMRGIASIQQQAGVFAQAQTNDRQIDIILSAFDPLMNKNSLLQLMNKVDQQLLESEVAGVVGGEMYAHRLKSWCYHAGQKIDALYQDLIQYHTQLNQGANVNKQLLLESVLLRWQTIFKQALNAL